MLMDMSMDSSQADAGDSDVNHGQSGEGAVAMDIDQPRNLAGHGQDGFDFGVGGNSRTPSQSYTTPIKSQPPSNPSANNTVLSRRLSSKMSLGPLNSPTFFSNPNVNITPTSSSPNGTNLPSAPNSALSASFTTHRSPVAGIPDTPNAGPNGAGEAKSPRLRSEGISPPVGEGSPTPSGTGTGFGFGFGVGGGGKQNQGGGGVAQSPFAGVPANSPWAHLAAAAGAPTPSLDGPGGAIHSPFGYPSGSGGSSGGGAGSGGLAGNFSFPAMLAGGAAGRSISPHLGAPFEMLNIGNGNGNPIAGPSKSPMGWPGVVAGEAVQTPGIAAAGMADPFSSLPVAGSGSGSAAGASPGGNGIKFNMGSNSSSTISLPAAGGSPAKREGGFALDAMAAFAAKRRGSKSGPSSLSKSATPSTASSVSEGKDGQFSRSRTGSVEDMKLPSGPVAGPGRLPNSTNGGMKLNLPAGLGARPAGISSTNASASATPGTSLSASSTPGMSMSKMPGGKTASPLLPYPLHASQIPGYLDREPGEALLLDLRPPSSFNNRRLPRSLSVPVPSTLLKRQTFDLQKIAQMLPAKQNQLIMDFRQAKDIIILDHDSVIAGPGSVIAGLATKFGTALQSDSVDNEWQGKIWFVKGGFVACEEIAGIDFAEGEEPADGPGAEPGAVYGAEAKVSDKQGRMVGALDPTAFRQGERKSVAGRAQPTKSLTLPSTPMVKFDLGGRPALGGDHAPRTLSNAADAPMSPTSRAATTTPNGTGQPRTGRGEVTEATTLQPANPFFDNIRQNLELAHGGITERIQLQLPPDVYSRLKELPPFLRDIVGTSPETVATKVAKEFEGIERDEQRRLQGIMEWHSRGSQVTQSSSALPKLRRLDSTGLMKAQSGDKEPEDDEEYFPFSITAGVERGSKNRYKNIWPYDFSRVRLKERCHDDGSDYINANFVQPRGTTRRYIATQGPLDATFQDFWTLVWEQHIHVIVMLTKQFEGGSLKCGSYWTGGTYGPFKLELISTKGGEDEAEKDISGFNFHVGKSGASQDAPNIKRSFLLTHTGQADVKPRKIVQIQCVSWPDFDVPEDPRTLLSLVKEVDVASGKLTDEEDEAERKPPVLVHCSAGVGRTGSFMIVDSILEALRREHNRQHRKIRGSHSSLRTRRQSQQTGDSAHSDADAHSENGRSEHRRGSSASIVLESHSPSTSILSRHGSHFPAMPSPLREFTQAEKDLRTTTVSPDAMEAEAEPQAQPFWLKDGARRWSVTSGKAMKSPSIEHEFPDEMAFIPRIGGDQQVDREPSPISEMESPVKNVLAGMRIQRMSLVQSLRQYAFVYRAIIYGYLDMLDEEKEAEAEVSAMHAASRTPGGSGATTDEESHVKRRASPTSLSGASLSKRPSIKISRQPSDEKDGDGGSALIVEGGKGPRGRGRAVSVDPSDSDSMDMD